MYGTDPMVAGAATTAAGTGLAFTGAHVLGLTVLAVGLLLAGLTLLSLTRRREPPGSALTDRRASSAVPVPTLKPNT